MFKFFKVGGCVRDHLLGREPKDTDYVVVGETPESMLARGYQQVGADFPVFLHPETREEYALARKEVKDGTGYKGFSCHFGPDVTLEEDLYRRDLTINAMAQDEDGKIIDPFNGQQDLQDGVLRHVSDAFAEDPLRVLRVARFAARYIFSIHPGTMNLMQHLVDSGEMETLTPERVWQETENALDEREPSLFFKILHSCDALDVLIPGLSAGAIHRVWTSKGFATNAQVRFALLLHDNEVGVAQVCDKLKVPNKFRELAILVQENADFLAKDQTLDATHMLRTFYRADAFRRKERFRHMVEACDILEYARWHHKADTKDKKSRIFQALDSCQNIDFFSLDIGPGIQIKDAVFQKWLEKVKTCLS